MINDIVSEEQFLHDIKSRFDKSTLDSLTQFGIQFLHQAIKIYKNKEFTREQLRKSLEEIANHSSRTHGEIVDWFMDYCEKNLEGKNYLFNKSIKAISKQRVGTGSSRQNIEIIKNKQLEGSKNIKKSQERILRIGKEIEKGREKTTLKIILKSNDTPCLNLDMSEKEKNQENDFEDENDNCQKRIKQNDDSQFDAIDSNQQMQLLLSILAATLQRQQDEQQEQQVSQNSSSQQQQRCRFFPNCQNPNCSFLHPTQICRYFPYCKRGSNCIYIHQQCKHGIHCVNMNCCFDHPKGRNSYQE